MRIRFDRGTLVLDRVTEGVDPEKLVGAAWDRELEAWRLPAAQLSGLKARLSDEGVRFSDEIGQPPAPIGDRWRLPELRWFQAEAVAAWRANGNRGVVALPTGSGKTLVAIAAIRELATPALVIVPTRVLLDQWARALDDAWGYPAGRLGDGDHHVAPITIATYASAALAAPRLGDLFRIVVVDEAHHVGAWCPADALDMMVAPARLGLTATPPRAHATPWADAPWPARGLGIPAAEHDGALARCIGPVVYARSVAELVGDALAPHDLVTVPIELATDERLAYGQARAVFSREFARFRRARPSGTWREFAHEAQQTARGRTALAAWRTARAIVSYPAAKRQALRELLALHAAQRVLVFTGDNATAYEIARELLVMPITCDIGRTERERMLARFESGDATVLVSSQVLDEGFDVPEAEVAIVVGGTASARRHVQRIGRVLRPKPGKRARVYELATRATTEMSQLFQRRRGVELEVASELGRRFETEVVS